MSAPTTETANYAVCVDCGIDLATPEGAQAHRSETREAATPDANGSRRGHATRVVNPTPAERVRSDVHQAIERAMERCFEELDRDIERGHYAEADVTDALRDYPDFSDGWDEWREDADQ